MSKRTKLSGARGRKKRKEEEDKWEKDKGQSQSVCSSSWNESEFDKPSLFFLLSDTASSTLYFLVPPLQIHTEEEGCNQH
ncbi:hypothetical protein NQZ68_010240, partial [Dissostichus eleginoides]